MLLTDMTLAEQLKITDRRIADRKRLMGITEEDERNMLAAKSFMDEHLDMIIEGFYRTQLSHAEVELVIGDADTLRRLKSSMRCYLQARPHYSQQFFITTGATSRAVLIA